MPKKSKKSSRGKGKTRGPVPKKLIMEFVLVPGKQRANAPWFAAPWFRGTWKAKPVTSKRQK
jgi:hypothetical protein